ncbi:hypothetical protein NL676_039788 [Syzygium grande]|nr:hypothetical protein NL676_039788 [Syzygium grande]
MEDFGSKKRGMPQPTAALAKKRKKQQRTMAGNAPVQRPRPCAVEGKDNPNRHCFDGSEKVMKARTAQLSMIYDNVGYPDVERMLRAEKLKQRFANVILKAKLLIHGEADIQEKPASRSASRPAISPGILQQRSSVEKPASRLAISSDILQQSSSVKKPERRPSISSGILQQRSSVEKPASRPAISSEILQQRSSVEKPARRLAIRYGILRQRSSVEKPASRPVIRSGISQQRSSVKTELRRELERKREVARNKVQSMKRTADLAENLDTLKELKRVFGPSPWVTEAFDGARRENPLEKLGLFLKDASVDEDIEADLLDREGEIY